MFFDQDRDSDFLSDPSSTAGAALFALAVIGHVHPNEVGRSDEDWKAAQAELDTAGVLLDVDAEGRYFVAQVGADGYVGGLPQKVRAIVERNPAWRRAVVRCIWTTVQDRARVARDFIASALAEAKENAHV